MPMYATIVVVKQILFFDRSLFAFGNLKNYILSLKIIIKRHSRPNKFTEYFNEKIFRVKEW